VLFSPARFGLVFRDRETKLIVVDAINPGDRDHVMLEACAKIELREFNLITNEVIDAPHVFSV